jgi:co-chaperonin GroES (HSP10)
LLEKIIFIKFDMESSIDNLIVVGDRVLIKPKTVSSKTGSGLFLPPGYKEKEEVQSGYVVKVGPGYPIPLPSDDFDEPWKKSEEKVKYIPLQAKTGDLAIFLKKGAVEVHYQGEKYFIVPQHSILLLERYEEQE